MLLRNVVGYRAIRHPHTDCFNSAAANTSEVRRKRELPQRAVPPSDAQRAAPT